MSRNIPNFSPPNVHWRALGAVMTAPDLFSANEQDATRQTSGFTALAVMKQRKKSAGRMLAKACGILGNRSAKVMMPYLFLAKRGRDWPRAEMVATEVLLPSPKNWKS